MGPLNRSRFRANATAKAILVAILLAASASAQSPPSACGPENVKFSVRLDDSHPPPPKPEQDKATIVFIQDFGARQFGIGIHPASRIGVDGAWVGAVKDNSYLFVSVEPAEHHICVSLDSEVLAHPAEFERFTAEAGRVYYVRWRYLERGILLLAPVDSDEAEYQISRFPLSVSKSKK